MTPEELLKKYAPWSISKAGVLADCTLKFHLNYDRKIWGPSTLAANVGTAAHYAIEYCLKVKKPVPDGIKAAILKCKLTQKESDALRLMEDAIEAFIVKFKRFIVNNRIPTVKYEEKMAVTFDMRPTAYGDKENAMIRGILDVNMYDPDRETLLILDHKSGEPSSISKYRKQFDCYAVMGAVTYPDVKWIRRGVHFIKNESVVWDKPISVEQVRDELFDWMRSYLLECCERLLDGPKPDGTEYCKWCGVRSHCPKYNEEIKIDDIVQDT